MSESSFQDRTCEEEDELQRSTKKVKETLESSNIPLNNQSYRDKLKGEIHGAYC